MTNDDFNRVKETVSLKEYAAEHLAHVHGGLVCPCCGSGTGANKSPAFSIKDDVSWKCFSCGAGGDVFDLAGIIHETEDRAEQLRIVAEWNGVPLEERRGGFRNTGNWAKVESAEHSQPTGEKKDDYAQGRAKHRQYIAECARRLLEEPNEAVNNYLIERGFTIDEAVKLGFGYDAKPKHGWQDSAGEWHRSPRLVIPYAGNDYYHIDRAIDGRADNLKYDKPPSDPNAEKGITEGECVGAQPLFNPDAFGQSYVIAVEGAFDAYAVQLCGYNAIALCGTACDAFANAAAACKYSGIVIDMLDADGNANDPKNGKGRYAGANLVSLLGEAGITTLSRAEYGIEETDDYGGHKDAGEWFAADRAGLSEMLEVMRGFALEKLEIEKGREYREALQRLKIEEPAKIAREIFNCEYDEQPISTGFLNLDSAMNGGMRSGLIVLGAVSSAGKTTLLSQIADFIAANGKPVLFVSIEQSGRELVSKSLSRFMAKRKFNDVTLYEMGAARYRNLWNDSKARAMADSVEEYAEVIAPNLRIMAASEQPTINDVKAAAYHIAEQRGESPVIMLDYLQILKPQSERDTERQAVDFNISELRRLSGGNGLKTPVITISSLNRGSYSGAISMESFKESGGVEYGADVLLGLQPYNMKQIVNARKKDGTPPTEQQMKFRAREVVDRFREQPIKDAELVFLKNRNGALPERPLPFTFYGASSLFIEGVSHF